MKTSFQAGVDSIYNAIVSQGTTPASKSLTDVTTGISTLSTNKYNSGYNQGSSDGYNTGYSAGYSEASSTRKSVTYMGTSTSTWTVSKYTSNYANLTTNNFIVGIQSTSGCGLTSNCGDKSSGTGYGGVGSRKISITYTASTGVLKVSGNTAEAYACAISGSAPWNRGNDTGTCFAYLVE